MKKCEPKMILNISIDNAELEEKVKIAMDEYAKGLIQKNLDNVIRKIITERIDHLIQDYKWGNTGKIDGKSLKQYVCEHTEDVIKEVIDSNIKDIFAIKVAEMLSK